MGRVVKGGVEPFRALLAAQELEGVEEVPALPLLLLLPRERLALQSFVSYAYQRGPRLSNLVHASRVLALPHLFTAKLYAGQAGSFVLALLQLPRKHFVLELSGQGGSEHQVVAQVAARVFRCLYLHVALRLHFFAHLLIINRFLFQGCH